MNVIVLSGSFISAESFFPVDERWPLSVLMLSCLFPWRLYWLLNMCMVGSIVVLLRVNPAFAWPVVIVLLLNVDGCSVTFSV